MSKINTVAVDFHNMRTDGFLNASIRNLDFPVMPGDQVLAQDRLNGGWAICRVVAMGPLDRLVLDIKEFYDGEL